MCLTEDTSHALINGAGQCDPVSGSDVVSRLLLAAELLIAEQTLELLFTETHHLLHLRIELLYLPFLSRTFTKYQL